MEPHDAPPPPYSETDLFSSSGHGQHATTGANRHADDASVTASSSHSNIVYTPPDTPDTPREWHNNLAASDDLRTTASAQVYFDTRAANAALASASPLTHNIVISPDPSPADFPLPEWAAAREITEQDWRTFINHLIPDYADKANSLLIDRKLRAVDDAQSSAGVRDATEAQLEHLRSSAQRRRFEDTVREWNAGFFTPRSVTIKLIQDSGGEPKARMPGAWDSTADANASTAPHSQTGPPAQERGADNNNSSGSWWSNLFGPRFPVNVHERGVRFGPFAVDGDRVTVGESFEADSRGVRWNGRDISNGHGRGRHLGPGASHRGRGPFGRGAFGHGGDPFGGRGPVGGGGPFGHGGGPFGAHGHNHGGPHDHHPSSSSSSSSDSDSSIGSLPDWDDLKDSQIPVVKMSIRGWLDHPEHPISRSEVKRVKSEIKAAKSRPQDPANPAQREEVKQLLQQFKELKKRQKANKRAQKKERRAERRARRQTHHAERRERHRGRREHRRAGRDHDRQQRNGGDYIPVTVTGSSIPHDPAIIAAPVMVDPFGVRSGPGAEAVAAASTVATRARAQAAEQAAHARAVANEEAVRARARAHVDATSAREQAARRRDEASQARAQAYEQAGQARAQAREQATQARARAWEVATQARAEAHRESTQARQQARDQVASAKASASAAAARWRGEDTAAAAAEQWERNEKVQIPPPAPTQAQMAAAEQRHAAANAAAERLEAEIAGRRRALQKNDEKARGTTGKEREAYDEANVGIEREISDLEVQIEQLMVEADEEFARGVGRWEMEAEAEQKGKDIAPQEPEYHGGGGWGSRGRGCRRGPRGRGWWRE